MLGIAQDRKDKHRADREAVIAFDMLTKGINPELEEVFRGERDLLFDDSLKTEEFARKLEKETGDSITAQEFRDMAGWEKYALAEAWLRDQAKDYEKYFLEAYDNTEVYVDRDGVQTKITQDNVQTPAEQAALDEKIKFNYARRFAGLNESLIATVLKPEIDKYDEKRRNKQALQREKAYQVQIGESDKRFIETSFITANPADGFDNANKFAQRFAAREGTSIGVGRLAFADYLVKAVSNDDITYPEAMSILSHEEKARDGSMKSMTSWKELPERLSEAAGSGRKAREDKRETMINADLEVIEQKDDWTNDQKQQMREYYKDRYSEYGDIVPYELQDALADYEDDSEAKRRLDRALLRQNDKVYDFQLTNVSPTVYNDYKDKLTGTNALVQGTEDAKRAAQYIRGYTDIGTGTTTTETDTASPNWINLNRNLTAIFNEEYQAALFDKDGVKINTNQGAFKIALDEVKKAATDSETATRLQNDLFDSDSNEEKLRHIRVSINQAGGGKWKTNKIYASISDQNDLINWAKDKSPTSRGIPEHYKEVAEAIEVAPYDLAQRQAAILSEGEVEVKDREVDEIENKPNRLRLLYHYPTKSRYIRSFIDYGYELNGEEPNVKTDVYNKKVLLTPGV